MSQYSRRQTFGLLFSALLVLAAAPAARGESPSFPSSCLLFSGNSVSRSQSLSANHYQVRFESCQSMHSDSTVWNSIRQFEANGRRYSLLVEPNTLETALVDRACLRCQEGRAPENSLYSKAISESLNRQHSLSNDGISHGKTNKGVYLTVDLCPSHREFDQEIFDNPQVNSRSRFPVAVAVSGGWIRHHERDLNWLKNEVLEAKLNIVWVNHSLTHPYAPHTPNIDNFLLTPGTDFSSEVLGEERLMIESGVTPSLFFRFPGLISSESLVRQLSQWGLLAVGSDAWLALGQKPKAGSVILIHGNGNEPPGVHLFMGLLQALSNASAFRSLSQILSE